MAAISKYIGENFKVPANYPKQLSVQMRKMVEAGKLKKDKVKGASGFGDVLGPSNNKLQSLVDQLSRMDHACTIPLTLQASYRLGDAMKEAAKPKRARMTGKEVEGETKKKMGEKKAAKRGSKKPAAEGEPGLLLM